MTVITVICSFCYNILNKIFFLLTGNMLSRGWSFTTPSRITGMRGSCVVIPCRFSYATTQPAGLTVIWYLFQDNVYIPVFDTKQSVIGRFRGITSVIGSVTEGNCSLKIERLEMSHNQNRLYPWIDKNPITSYHTQGHSLYDKTSQLIVSGQHTNVLVSPFAQVCSAAGNHPCFDFSDHAQEPQLSITEIPRVGEQSRVSCIVQHSCISDPPILTLNGITGVDHTVHTLVSEGIWERKIERIWTVREEDQSVECAVSYRAGQKATSVQKINVECEYSARLCVVKRKHSHLDQSLTIKLLPRSV